MARISIRIFVVYTEHDRIDEDLQIEAVSGLVDACKQAVEESKPLTPEEAAEVGDAWAMYFDQTQEQRSRR